MKIRTFLFLLVWILILGLTLQNGNDSASLTHKTQEWIYDLLSIQVDFKMLRRVVHIPEYFLLGMSAAFLFRDLKSIPLCLGFSFCDQMIKSFVPTKEFDALDMVFDFVGYMTGIGIVSIFGIIIK